MSEAHTLRAYGGSGYGSGDGGHGHASIRRQSATIWSAGSDGGAERTPTLSIAWCIVVLVRRERASLSLALCRGVLPRPFSLLYSPNLLEKLSEKPRRRLQRCPGGRQSGAVRSISASV